MCLLSQRAVYKIKQPMWWPLWPSQWPTTAIDMCIPEFFAFSRNFLSYTPPKPIAPRNCLKNENEEWEWNKRHFASLQNHDGWRIRLIWVSVCRKFLTTNMWQRCFLCSSFLNFSLGVAPSLMFVFWDGYGIWTMPLISFSPNFQCVHKCF